MFQRLGVAVGTHTHTPSLYGVVLVTAGFCSRFNSHGLACWTRREWPVGYRITSASVRLALSGSDRVDRRILVGRP